MTQKAKKALALEIIERLKQEYPDAGVHWITTRPGSF